MLYKMNCKMCESPIYVTEASEPQSYLYWCEIDNDFLTVFLKEEKAKFKISFCPFCGTKLD